MKHKFTTVFLINIFFVLLAAGCAGQGITVNISATPTETLMLTETPTATSTMTPTQRPTTTPTPDLTPSAPVSFFPGDVHRMDAAGYAFTIPTDVLGIVKLGIYDEESVVVIFPPDDTYFIILEAMEVPQSLQIVTVIQNMKDSNPGIEYIVEDAPVSIGEYEGVRVFAYDDTEGIENVSEMVMVKFAQTQLLIMMCQANGSTEEPRWEYIVKPMFDFVIDTLVLFDPVEETGSSGCQISTDSTYGYSEENPIRVGGDFLTGPSRERAYLDNLRGPNGEIVQYVRLGSLQFGDTILDEYQLTIAGSSTVITLYLDEYSWSTPMAPVGLTCGGPFTLSEP
jgi:hypothetical protein